MQSNYSRMPLLCIKSHLLCNYSNEAHYSLLPVQPRTSREPIVLAVRLKFGFHSTNPTSASRSYPITAMTSHISFNERPPSPSVIDYIEAPRSRIFVVFLLRIRASFPPLEFLPHVSLDRMQGNSRTRPFPSV